MTGRERERGREGGRERERERERERDPGRQLSGASPNTARPGPISREPGREDATPPLRSGGSLRQRSVRPALEHRSEVLILNEAHHFRFIAPPPPEINH